MPMLLLLLLSPPSSQGKFVKLEMGLEEERVLEKMVFRGRALALTTEGEEGEEGEGKKCKRCSLLPHLPPSRNE